MSEQIKIGGRLHSVAVGNVVAGANEILDDTKGKKQNVINQETDAELERLENAKQDNLTFDTTPTEGSTNPITSGGVFAADAEIQQAIEAILLLIPSAASALNQLADKAFVNSTVATNTATFRGTYNVVTDLELHYDATHQQIATALLSKIQEADNNDYCFVQIPVSDSSGDIRVTERYKFNGTAWAYEYDLNNSGFTAAQWAAINSTITLALVQKLNALPNASELATQLAGKQNTLTFDDAPVAGSNNPVKSGGLYAAFQVINATIPAGASADNKLVAETRLAEYVAAIINALDATYNVTSTDGHVNVRLTQVDGAITSLEVLTSDIASAADVTALTTRVSTNEADIAQLQAAYEALTQSTPVIVEPTDTWPVATPEEGVIYRVVDRVNTPPQYYEDYMYNGTAMVLMGHYNNAIDAAPTAGSHNLVESGGVASHIVYDISEANAVGSTLATYADLAAALGNNGDNIPPSIRKGGMSVKYVQSSDNKYVQARLMADSFTTDITQWQGVDDEPTAGSNNLVKSGGVANDINQLGLKIGTISVSDYLLTAGANNVLSIGDVKTGDKITVNAKLGFTPNQTWYLSLFSNGQEIVPAKSVSASKTETIWNVEFNQEHDDIILVISAWGTVGNVSVSVSSANNISEQIETINGLIYDNITKQKEFVMSINANPTISFDVRMGLTCVVSVSGMSGTQYAEGGVNDENGNTIQTFLLNSANNWEKEIVLVGDAKLFWLVCKGTTGQNGVFSVVSKESAIVIERNRAIAAESLNAEHIENNSDSINSIKELLKEKEQVSGYPIVYGINDIFDLGDVEKGQIIELIGTIDFVPSENWYLSIQTQQGEMVSYTFQPSQNSFSKTIVFADNRTDVKVAISVYGSVFGNIDSTCSFSDSYEYIKKVVDGLDKFAYNVIRGCLGSGKTNDEYYSIDGTAGFDSAMSVMQANLGGKIIVPSGQYRISSPIVLNTHCVNIEGSIWNYPNHPNGVYESNNGTKIKIESQNIAALIIRTGAANGFRISQIGFAGTIPNGATKGIFDKSNPFVNCGVLMESYHDQYEIRRVSCEGFAVGFAGNEAGMDAGIIECFNADGCNIGIYCENTASASTCYYFKICHNVLSDCPAFGIYMNGKVGDSYKYLGAEIFGNTLVRNGGGFTDAQIEDFGGDSECAAVHIKGIHKGSFHDNIIQNAGAFNNVSGETPVIEYQTRKFCILDTKLSLIIGNQFLDSGTSVDLYGDDNNIANNISTGNLIINGSNNNVTGNKIYRIIINGSGNLVQGNKCVSQLITINGDNNIVIAPASYTITDNGTGNTVIRLN